MTLEEMQLAVCEKLQDVVDISNDGQGPCYWTKRHEKEIDWPTEGLAVCHEAEKLLKHMTPTYVLRLHDVCGVEECINTTWQQRLEALCRVWYPERFPTL